MISARRRSRSGWCTSSPDDDRPFHGLIERVERRVGVAEVVVVLGDDAEVGRAERAVADQVHAQSRTVSSSATSQGWSGSGIRTYCVPSSWK